MAEESILGGFSGLANVAQIGSMILWIGFFLIIAIAIGGLALLLMVKLSEVPVYEIDLVTRRFRKLRSRLKKHGSGRRYPYLPKYKKFLPNIQQEDKLLCGKKDTILLIKDNNGLHHTARLPSFDEFLEHYDVGDMNEFDMNNPKKSKWIHIFKTIYLQPNPSEDLEWLAQEVSDSKKEFMTAWWKSPAFVWIGTLSLCAVTFIITIIISRKI